MKNLDKKTNIAVIPNGSAVAVLCLSERFVDDSLKTTSRAIIRHMFAGLDVKCEEGYVFIDLDVSRMRDMNVFSDLHIHDLSKVPKFKHVDDGKYTVDDIITKLNIDPEKDFILAYVRDVDEYGLHAIGVREQQRGDLPPVGPWSND